MKTQTNPPDQIAVVQYQAWLSGQVRNRCSCFDSECVDVESPLLCWIGNEALGGFADGHCPLMFREES